MVVSRYSPAVGGIEKHLHRVNAYLSRAGYAITVLTSSHERDLRAHEKIDGVDVFRIPFGWEKNPPLVYGWILKNRKRLQGCRVVHVHGTVPLMFWYLPLRLLNPVTPTFATFHGFERDPVPVLFRVLRKVARRLVKKAMCIGRFIERIYGIKCDHITIGAVDSPPAHVDGREGAVYVGRLEEDTGIREHIIAMGLLKNKYGIEVPLTVCGSGSLKDELSNLASSKGIDVRFEGIVPNAVSVMNKKKLALAAGYLSILEAMSLGLPVIAVCKTPLKHQYLRGVLEAGGSISIQTSAEGVADEIMRIMKNPELVRGLSERGMQFASRMTWKRMAQNYIHLWTEN